MAKKMKMNEETLLFAVMLVFAAAVAYYVMGRIGTNQYRLIEGADPRDRRSESGDNLIR